MSHPHAKLLNLNKFGMMRLAAFPILTPSGGSVETVSAGGVCYRCVMTKREAKKIKKEGSFSPL